MLAVAGNSDPGVNWLCASPACDTVLAAAVHERQLLDLLFRCYHCSTVGASPEREPGQPIPPLWSEVIPEALLVQSGIPTEIGGGPTMFVGQRAVDGYVRETGWRVPGVRPAWEKTAEVSPAGLRDLADEAIALIGERYQKLRATHDRRRASSSQRNRLIELIEHAERTAELLEREDPREVLARSKHTISELATTITLFRRWRRHPVWRELQTSLGDPGQVQHTVILLTVASMLVDAKNGVGLVSENDPGGRRADLWLQPTFERLDLEVKTPQALRGPLGESLTSDHAVRIVETRLDQAAQQLDPNLSGIVAIGGYH